MLLAGDIACDRGVEWVGGRGEGDRQEILCSFGAPPPHFLSATALL